MVINLEQKKIHFDLRFILTYNIHVKLICSDTIIWAAKGQQVFNKSHYLSFLSFKAQSFSSVYSGLKDYLE